MRVGVRASPPFSFIFIFFSFLCVPNAEFIGINAEEM